jgi:hypothetical protein
MDDLKQRGITVWTLQGQYDLWSMQHPEGPHKDEYEGQWVKADEAAAALDAKDAEIARYRAAIQRALDEAVADDMDEWYAELRAALTGSPR